MLKKNNETEKKLESSEKLNAEKNRKNLELDSELESIKTKLASTEVARDQLQKKSSELVDEQRKLEVHKDNLISEINRHKVDVQHFEDEFVKMKEEVDEFKSNYNKIELENSSWQNRFETVVNDLESSKKESDEIKN